MTRSRSVVTFLASSAVLSLAGPTLAGCGGDDSDASTSATRLVNRDGQPATVGVATTGLGDVLVDSLGRTLYLFQIDSGTTSVCTGECATFWPPLTANGTPTVGSGANVSLVGTTARSDGTSQVTYNGHPVYLYQGDHKAGDTSGEGLVAFGGGWFALSATGDQVPGPTQSSGSGSGTSGGSSGY